MSALYERFIREYYLVHHPELSPRAASVAWDINLESAHGISQLPSMVTDVTLRSADTVLIIDAKYYGQSLRSKLGGAGKVHSGNLYQLLSYVKNADQDRDGSVSGLLLYAHTGHTNQPDLNVTVQGNRIGARALNLNLPWPDLRVQLEEILEWLSPNSSLHVAST